MVAEAELDDFGLAADQLLSDPLSLEMIQKDAEVSVTISMVNAVYSAVIPIPAAVWLLGSGLIGLVALARRRCC